MAFLSSKAADFFINKVLNTGKRLMSKCRLLHQENEELGKIISSGLMAKLEGDLALQKSFSEEMKKSQSGIDIGVIALFLTLQQCLFHRIEFDGCEVPKVYKR